MARKKKPVDPVAATPVAVPVETTPPEPTDPAPPFPAVEPKGGESPKSTDPVGVQSIDLSGSNAGPKMRLFRSHKYHQMRIQFDEKPAEAVRERLSAEGWKWRGGEQVWTKQLDRDARWRSQADAERLFQELANGIRAERGLPPTADLGRG